MSRYTRFAPALLIGVAAIGMAAPANAGPDNLVQNPSLEDGATWPTCFTAAGWGTEGAWSSVPGRTGARAVALEITGHTDGDRKLMPTETEACAPIVAPGARYDLSIWYTSTSPVSLTLFRHTAAGWSYWGDLGTQPAAADWHEATGTTPPIPEGTDRVTFGLSLGTDGRLVTDDYSLVQVNPTGEPPPSDELVVNGDLVNGAESPDCFFVAGWGERTLGVAVRDDVPDGAPAGARSVELTVSGHVSGDAKLLQSEAAGCAPSVVPGELYTASVDYRATGTAHGFTVFRHTPAGWSYWTELDTLPASPDWTTATAALPPIPADVDRISFGISLASDGVLATTGYSLVPTPDDPGDPDPPPGGPEAAGSWSVFDSPLPVRAIHTTLLHDGRLLLIAGSGNDGTAFAAGQFRAVVWDPRSGQFTDIPVPYDMFCAGHVTLPDGKVLLAGGTLDFPAENQGPNTFKGSDASYYFDPSDDSFHPLADMAGAHWYPTLTKLGNGDIWAAGGLDDNASGTVLTELFDVSAMTWLPSHQVPQTWSFWGTYPHMYLLDDGTLFYAGGHTFGNGLPGTGASLYDWETAQIWDVPGLREKDLRDQAGSVLLPPAQEQRVMIVGGGNTDTGTAAIRLVDIIDLSAPSPSYQPGPDLPGPGKIYVNLVTLPDRTVLATGGAQYNRMGDVLTAAIYDPAENDWTSVAADPVGRNYHATATLLPDGRVVVLGSNPADNSFETRISIYSPPYLHRGERPTVTGAPSTLGYGEAFGIQVEGDVVSASLLAPMSPTHQTDTNARLIDLPLAGTGTHRQAQVPDNPDLVPPGPYMLTVLDAAGIPSEAIWVWVS